MNKTNKRELIKAKILVASKSFVANFKVNYIVKDLSVCFNKSSQKKAN